MRIKHKILSLGIFLAMIFLLSSCSSLFSGIDTHLPVRKVSSEPKKVIPNDQDKEKYLFKMGNPNLLYGALLNKSKLLFYKLGDGTLFKAFDLKANPIAWNYYGIRSKDDALLLGINFVYTYPKNNNIYLSCIHSPYEKIEFSQNWEIKTACEDIINNDFNLVDDNIYLLSKDKRVYEAYNQDGKQVKSAIFRNPVLFSPDVIYDGQYLYSASSQTKYYLHEKEPVNKAFFPQKGIFFEEGRYSEIGILYDGEYLYDYDYQNNKGNKEDSIVCIKFPGLKNTPRPSGTILTNNGILLEHGGIDTYEYMQIVQGSYDALPVINTSKSLYKKNYVFSERGSSVSFFYKEVDGAIKIIALDYNKMAFSFDNDSSPMVDMILIYELEDIPGKLLSDVEIVRENVVTKRYVDPRINPDYIPPGKVVNGIYVPPKTHLVFNTTKGVYECDVTRVFENVYIDRINDKTPGIILDHGKVTDQRNSKDKIVFYKPEVRRILPENDNKK
ncbi:MAG TPA: hypothetical protein PL190_07200 [Caldisericia bacterium]|nr:MAG: hypothetical protein BWX90_01485 [bacterium ADurb.Bin132]HNY61822.1 hypothetical protein [Caldisericia bacterium]HOC79651.1 hypothetical protein [Caldisericia bacterium]HOG70942.1 hypothetical protein [Caldisericia bacterium]HPA66293.1 hypothetical protein [Caldisericia bacterium]